MPLNTTSTQPAPLHPAVKAALLVWTIFALALAIKIIAAPGVHTVFPKFVAGSDHWWHGLPLYAEYERLGPFRYSPTFAVLMTPFAWAGLTLGGLLWAMANIAAYGWAIRLLVRLVLPGEWPPAHAAALAMLALPGALRGFWNGQSNPLVAAALIVAVAALARRKWWLAAALFTAGVILKLSPLVVGLLFAAMFPWRLGPRLLAAVAIAAVLPFLTQSPGYVLDQYHDWAVYLVETAGKRWPSFRDLRTLWEWAGVGTDSHLYVAVQAFAGLAVLLWSFVQKRRWADQPRMWLTLTWAAGTGYLILMGPAVESPTYVVLAPVTAWAVMESLRSRVARPLAIGAFVLTSVFTDGSAERAVMKLSAAGQAALPFGTLLLIIWVAWYATTAWTRRRRSTCHI